MATLIAITPDCYHASRKGWLTVVKILIEERCIDPNLMAGTDLTPLFFAIK